MDELWDGLKKKFSFPPDSDNIVKNFAWKQMAISFRCWRSGLNTRYLKVDRQPFKRFRDIRTEQWGRFVQQNTTPETLALSAANTELAKKNILTSHAQNTGCTGT
jgi:hypothetical protein